MECDVILNVGGEEVIIKKEDSLEELSSLLDIALYIKDNWSSLRRSNFIKGLLRSSSLLTEDELKFMGKPLIGNSSVEQIKLYSQEAREILEKIPNLGRYNITLLNNAYTNGLTLKGRVIGNSIISYVIRNQYDAINFAKTEYIKYLVNLLIEGNNIVIPNNIEDSKYLTDKYKDKLLEIKSKHSKKIKQHLKELHPDFEEDITIKHLLEDYLNYKSDYTDLIQVGDHKIDLISTISDFLRELQYEPLYQESTETILARRLRAISYDRTSFGKKEFYDAIKAFGTELQQLLLGTEEEFMNLSLNDMLYLIQEIFKDDIILSKYSVKSVEKTLAKKLILKKSEVDKLILNKNKSLDKDSLVSEKELNTVEGVKEFFGENFTITKNGISYKLDVEPNKDKIRYFYYSKKLEDDTKIILSSKGKTVSEDFKIEGYDTMSLFHHVELYKGYHIYEYSPNKSTVLYVISKSIIHPNLFNLMRAGSIKDAQQSIDNLVRSEIIEKATNIDLKFSSTPRTAYIKGNVSIGQALTSLQYPIKNGTKLNSEEYTLFSSAKMFDVHNFYKDTFNIDISALDDAEKVGIFLYAMTNNLLTIENMRKNGVSQKDRELILSIIDGINEAEVQHFLVEKSNKSDDKNKEVKGGLIYLKYLKDSDINYEGISVDGLLPQEAVKRRSLENVKNLLEEGIFKETPISINNISKETASTMKNEKGDLLFEDISLLDLLQAFVHDNNIYVVVDNADVREMIHETLHIVLGAMRAKDFKSYELLLNKLYTDTPDVFKKQADKYKNFALLDRKEEAIVRHLANRIQNGLAFFNTDAIASEDMVKNVYKTFIGLSGDIKKAINKNDDWFGDGGFTFPNKIKELLKDLDLLGKMKKNRIAANIIKKGISNGTIKLKGEC